MTITHFLAALCAAALCVALPAHAGDGHDHGEAAPVAAGPALPRFAATSELFELVGVLQGKHITLYLDRAADNSPVADAQIELEIGGSKVKAARHGTDEFEVVLAAEPKPGVLPVTAVVTVGSESDLLAGELDLHEAAHPETAHTHSWKEYLAWGTGAAAALAALLFVGRRIAARKASFGGAA